MKIATSVLALAMLSSVLSAVSAEHLSFPTKTCSPSCKAESTRVVLDGFSGKAADYKNKGVSVSGNALTLQYSSTTSPHVYITASDAKYKMYNLLNKEIAFDIDTSKAGCSAVGSLYFVSMKESGASNGGGYCDALGGVGSKSCAEFDVWEGNKVSTQLTAHASLGSSIDRAGCSFNSYKDLKTLFGPGGSFSVDSTKKVTVVTQFVTKNGELSDVKRFYKQNGKKSKEMSLASACGADKLKKMGTAFKNGGMVAALGIWSASSANWLNASSCSEKTGTAASVTFSDLRVGNIGSTTASTTKLRIIF